MPIKVTCQECDTVLKAPSKLGGKKARCPGCNAVLEIPKKKSKKKKKREEPDESDVFSALSSAAGDSSTSASPRSSAGSLVAPATKKKKGSPLAIILVLLVMVAAGGGVAFLVVSMQKEPPVEIDPNSADGAMTLLLKDFNAKTFWTALPDGYKSRANGVMHSLGGKLGEDKQVYDQGFVALSNLAKEMAAKEGLFQQSELVASAGFTKSGLINNWKDVPAALEIIAKSNLGESSKLGDFDWGKYFDTEQAVQAFGHLLGASKMLANQITLADLTTTSVEKISGGDGEAKLKFNKSGRPSREMEFATVGGKWMPLAFITDWNNFFDAIEKDIASFPKEGGMSPEFKAKAMGWITDIEQLTTNLKAAKSVKDLDEALLGSTLVGPVLKARKKAHDAAKAEEEAAKKKEVEDAKKNDAKKGEGDAAPEDGEAKKDDGGAAAVPNPAKPLPGGDIPKTKSVDLPGL